MCALGVLLLILTVILAIALNMTPDPNFAEMISDESIALKA